MAKKICDICGNKVGIISQYKLKDGIICFDCKEKMGKGFSVGLETITVEQAKKAQTGEMELIPPREYGLTTGTLVIDSTNRAMYVRLPLFQRTEEIPMDSVVGYSYIEDEKEYGVGHVLGGAAIGGLIFGGAGAVIGSVIGSNPKRKISYIGLDVTYELSGHSELFKIKLYKGKPIKVSSFEYNDCMEKAKAIMGELDMLIQKNPMAETDGKDGSVASAADEIRKFKGLLDDGIISQEEFEAKKKELLGL